MTTGDIIDLINRLDKDNELEVSDLEYYSVPEIVGEVYREYWGNELNKALLTALLTLIIKMPKGDNR